ncbi:MAG: DMT family transporter [Pseudomonadota bacterium]
MSTNVIGALLMMASMACFTINDTFIKMTEGALPLSQLLFLRGVLSTLFITGLAIRLRGLRGRVHGQDWLWIAIRSCAEVAAAYFFISALLNMPIANITAILQLLPLTVTLGAALFFREEIGWRRMLAIGLGFGGMLLIVRPGTEGFTIWSLYGIAAVGCVTLRDLATRKVSEQVPSVLVTLMSSVIMLLSFGSASLAVEWAPLTPRLAGLIFASSLFIVGAYFFSVQVMRQGSIASIAPFRYSGLIWALVLGWLVFGEWPEALTLLGAAIIVGTGLFTIYRERKLAADELRAETRP